MARIQHADCVERERTYVVTLRMKGMLGGDAFSFDEKSLIKYFVTSVAIGHGPDARATLDNVLSQVFHALRTQHSISLRVPGHRLSIANNRMGRFLRTRQVRHSMLPFDSRLKMIVDEDDTEIVDEDDTET